jgi:hypothetical protein
MKLKEDFGGQYKYFNEDLDPQFPIPLVPKMDINIFVDANHAHDKEGDRTISHWLVLLCWIYTRIMEVTKTGKCPNIHVWSRIYSTEESRGAPLLLTIYMGVKVSKPTPILWIT